MPRVARKKSSTNIYHVVIRGADRQQIFEATNDYQKYLEILQLYKEELSFEIYAFCLMSNHIHLLINTGTQALENIFRHINTAYAVWFNMKYNRTGFLQQGRYYSEPVENIEYLITVVRYIHQNPLKAGLENYPGEKYPWSSFFNYIGNSSQLVDTQFIMNTFQNNQNFINLHSEHVEEQCLDVDSLRKRIPDDVAKDIIYKECNCSSTTEFQQLPLSARNNYILLLNKKGISIRQLNRLTGIPKGVIDRIVTKGHSS